MRRDVVPPLPERRRPTIRDVAAAAGVSRSAASRALRGTGYVGVEARRRVLAVADELGYVPHVTARSLKDRVSRCIGVVVPEVDVGPHASVLAGASGAAHGHGLATMVATLGGTAGDEGRGPADPPGEDAVGAALESIVAFGVAGVVLTAPSAAAAAYLARYGVPVVQAGHATAPQVDAVLTDPRAGTDVQDGRRLGAAAVECLVRRFAEPDLPAATWAVPPARPRQPGSPVDPPDAVGF